MDMKIMVEQRQIRGYSILAKGDEPKPIDGENFLIPSQNGNGKYRVSYKNSLWLCECPDFFYRRIECKHVHALKFWLMLKEKINSGNTFEIIRDLNDNESCPYCNSLNIVKNGSRKCKSGDKQRFRCRDCDRTFIPDKEFDKIKGDPKIITLVMDLYFKGVSLRKIKDHLKQFYKMEIHHETLRRWIVRFTKIMNDYVNKIQPKLSGKWQADEQAINSKGEWKWSWNILDEETRFLIANQVTSERTVEDARQVFAKAKQIASEKPETISTDGLWSYEKAIQKEFITWRHPQTEHIRLAGISKKRNNNKIERFHGSFRERDKVMRGFKGQEQAIINGYRTYYNFIRSHQALNGQTPSEKADINLGLNGGNRWDELLNKAINNKYDGLTPTTPMILIGEKRKRPRKTRCDKGIPRGHITINRKIREKKPIFKVRIFTPDGKEYDNQDKKFTTEFKTEEKAKEFVEFYKLLYPNFEFRIEEI